MNELLHKIKSFRFLPEGWDSYGAKPFTDEHLDNAVTLLTILNKKFSITPLHIAPFNGGIMFEYTKLPFILEVDVIHDGTYAYLQIENIDDSESYQEAGDLTLEDLLSDIEFMLCRAN